MNIENAYSAHGVNQNGSAAINNGGGVLRVENALPQNMATAPATVRNIGSGFLYVENAVGNNYGPGGSSVLAFAVNGETGTPTTKTFVKRLIFGPYGAVPVTGSVFVDPSVDNVCQFRESPNGPTKTLVDSSIAGDVPAESDVRALVVYNNGDNVGTCAVPLPGQTALDVPVDDTVGTAVLTADAIGQQDHRVYDDVEGAIGWILRRMQAGTTPGLPRAF
jgi:hypothetical protein